MSCLRPLKGYIGRELTKNGKSPIVFNPSNGYIDKRVDVPCGQCINCRLEYSRQWAIRCLHEAQMHDENCFVTLTYSDENLPKDGSLVLSDFQKFMKRLRRAYEKKIRFFHCGEYGNKFSRPHYHALLFGIDVRNKENNLFVGKLSSSKMLENLWNKGYNVVGDLNFDSCAYVARYIVKKVKGKNSVDHYCEIDKSNGLIKSERLPEYCTMSRRPGIGTSWFEKFSDDVYPSDSVIVNGKEVKPPKFYDKIIEKNDIEYFRKIKAIRNNLPLKVIEDNYDDRLLVKEKVMESKIKFMKRGYENG